jgi:mannose-6-phosphate isomerase
VTLLLIGNQPMPYAWGSTELIQDFAKLGIEGQPAAEVWFGSHPSSPAMIQGSNQSLADRAPNLGFLVKLLAAAKPLSIQAHPSLERAREQFQLGNPSYSDANHKPEMIIAISDFEALCGFREIAEIRADLTALAAASDAFNELLELFDTGGIKLAIEHVFENNLAAELQKCITQLSRSRNQLHLKLTEHFPGDVGVVIATVFMNYVKLAPGQALFLPAGNIHAYLSGLGVEVMAASDNVLRGGLTKKPIDVPELMQVLDFSPISDPRVKTKTLAKGLTHYPAALDDFKVYGVEVSASNMLIDMELTGSMIVVCVSGELGISTSTDEYLNIHKGQAAFVSDSRLFSVTGNGSGYLAMG